MKLVETRIYSQLMMISDYLLLGLLWVILSLPLITVIPASVGVLYVIRQWEGSSTGSILRYFFQGIKRYLPLNLLVSGLTIGIFAIVNNLMSESSQLLIISGYVISIVYLMFLFSWMYQCVWLEKQTVFQLFEQSALELILYFLRNLLCCGLTVSFTVLVFLFPPFIFIFAGGFWKVIALILFRKRQVMK
ncbi:DUF624 domain-containing protein [Enterococcus sp. LJL51]|uniref:DUF624 domain-containing protein n=1 Tax=Enterococcus sp. LJL51 TaxID=3416656 RepID=UPI003CEDEFC3